MSKNQPVEEPAIPIIRRIIQEPLLHFLVAGLVIFWGYSAINKDGNSKANDQVIVVDRASLLTFLQFRSRAFDPNAAQRVLDTMDQQKLDALIATYVREEALYRDALAMKLDKGDDLIKRRLVQKAEFLAQGFVELGLTVNDEMVRAYFDDHIELYREPAQITFTHVFFDHAEPLGDKGAVRAALATLKQLNADGVAFSEAIKYGDRFPFHLNYVESSAEEVAAHFGAEMTQQLFAIVPSNTIWHGPFVSSYGVHLVMVSQIKPARDPKISDVRGRIISDVKQREMSARTAKAIDQIVATYQVRIELASTRKEEN